MATESAPSPAALGAVIAVAPNIDEAVDVALEYLQDSTFADSLALTVVSPDAGLPKLKLYWRDNHLNQDTVNAIEADLLKKLTAGQHPIRYKLDPADGIVQEPGHSILLPIVVHAQTIGSLFLIWKGNQPANIDLDLIQLALQSIGLALENNYLFQAKQRYIQALEHLAGLATELNLLPRVEDIIARAQHTGCVLLNTKSCAIFRTHSNIAYEVYPYGTSAAFAEALEGSDISTWKQERLSESTGDHVVFVADTRVSAVLSPWRAIFRREGIQSIIMVPLFGHNQIIGQFAFFFDRTYTPDPYDVRIVEILAAQTAVALVNITLNLANQQHADILEQRVAERTEALAIALDKAEDATRLKGQLLSTVSHELRTPLSVIKAHATTMRSFYDKLPKERQMHYLATINEETDRLAGMIDNLLDMSRLESGRLDIRRLHIDPAPLLNEVMDDLQIRFPDRKFSLVIPSSINLILADPERVRQVVNNLAENAVKYSPAGSPVELGANIWDDGLETWVKDQGNGLTLEQSRRIFDRFYQVDGRTREARAGVGLGLAICKALVEEMGGRIWCQSPGLGQGSKFSFTLPWVVNAVAQGDEKR